MKHDMDPDLNQERRKAGTAGAEVASFSFLLTCLPKEPLNKAFNHRGTEDTEWEYRGLFSVHSVSRWLNQRFLSRQATQREAVATRRMKGGVVPSPSAARPCPFCAFLRSLRLNFGLRVESSRRRRPPPRLPSRPLRPLREAEHHVACPVSPVTARSSPSPARSRSHSPASAAAPSARPAPRQSGRGFAPAACCRR